MSHQPTTRHRRLSAATALTIIVVCTFVGRGAAEFPLGMMPCTVDVDCPVLECRSAPYCDPTARLCIYDGVPMGSICGGAVDPYDSVWPRDVQCTTASMCPIVQCASQPTCVDSVCVYEAGYDEFCGLAGLCTADGRCDYCSDPSLGDWYHCRFGVCSDGSCRTGCADTVAETSECPSCWTAVPSDSTCVCLTDLAWTLDCSTDAVDHGYCSSDTCMACEAWLEVFPDAYPCVNLWCDGDGMLQLEDCAHCIDGVCVECEADEDCEPLECNYWPSCVENACVYVPESGMDGTACDGNSGSLKSCLDGACVACTGADPTTTLCGACEDRVFDEESRCSCQPLDGVACTDTQPPLTCHNGTCGHCSRGSDCYSGSVETPTGVYSRLVCEGSACELQVCPPDHTIGGACVECTANAIATDCGVRACTAASCSETNGCEYTPCPGSCLDGACVECATVADCQTLACQMSSCNSGTHACAYSECPGGLCSSDKCVECLQDSDCSIASSCTVTRCNLTTHGCFLDPCAGPCLDGACVECANAAADCDPGDCQVVTCGGSSHTCTYTECPGGVCSDGGCVECLHGSDCALVGECATAECNDVTHVCYLAACTGPCLDGACVECANATADCHPGECQTADCDSVAHTCVYTTCTGGHCSHGICADCQRDSDCAAECRVASCNNSTHGCVFDLCPGPCLDGACVECADADDCHPAECQVAACNTTTHACSYAACELCGGGACVQCLLDTDCVREGCTGTCSLSTHECGYACGDGCVRGPYWWYTHAEWVRAQVPSLLPLTVSSNLPLVTNATVMLAILRRADRPNNLDRLAAALLVAKLNAAAGANAQSMATALDAADAMLAACLPNDETVWQAFLRSHRCGGNTPASVDRLTVAINAFNTGRGAVATCPDMGAGQ